MGGVWGRSTEPPLLLAVKWRQTGTMRIKACCDCVGELALSDATVTVMQAGHVSCAICEVHKHYNSDDGIELTGWQHESDTEHDDVSWTRI